MSNTDINTIVKKLGIYLIAPVLVIIIGQAALDYRADKKYREAHWTELYRLNAELSTTLAMYIKATDEDKARIWDRIDYIIDQMMEFSENDTKRTIYTEPRTKRKYGLNFTSLI